MTSAERSGRRRPDVTDVELVGGVEKRELFLVASDPRWPKQYDAHDTRIREAVGGVAVDVQHIGSTSVPGLAAKPIIDVLLLVTDITAEEDYLAPLLEAGYVLRVREPGHRMLRTPELDVHLHVREVGGAGVEDYALLRDQLRTDPADRALYEATKRDLLSRAWPDMNAYADAKTAVIEEIKGRARATRTSPHPVLVATYETGPAFLLGASSYAVTTWRGILCAAVPDRDPVPFVFRRDGVADVRVGGLTYEGRAVLAGRISRLACVDEQYVRDVSGLRLPPGVGPSDPLLLVV